MSKKDRDIIDKDKRILSDLKEIEKLDSHERGSYPAVAHLPEISMITGFVFLALYPLGQEFIVASLIFLGIFFISQGSYFILNNTLSFSVNHPFYDIKDAENNHSPRIWGGILIFIGLIIFMTTSLII